MKPDSRSFRIVHQRGTAEQHGCASFSSDIEPLEVTGVQISRGILGAQWPLTKCKEQFAKQGGISPRYIWSKLHKGDRKAQLHSCNKKGCIFHGMAPKNDNGVNPKVRQRVDEIEAGASNFNANQ